MRENYSQKIEDMADVLKIGSDKERAVASMLYVISAAITGGQELLLCHEINKIVQTVILPQLRQAQSDQKSIRN